MQQLQPVRQIRQRIDKGVISEPNIEQHIIQADRHITGKNIQETRILGRQLFMRTDIQGITSLGGIAQIQRNMIVVELINLILKAFFDGLQYDGVIGRGRILQACILAIGSNDGGGTVDLFLLKQD